MHEYPYRRIAYYQGILYKYSYSTPGLTLTPAHLTRSVLNGVSHQTSTFQLLPLPPPASNPLGTSTYTPFSNLFRGILTPETASE
jgi:hypothetical protein